MKIVKIAAGILNGVGNGFRRLSPVKKALALVGFVIFIWFAGNQLIKNRTQSPSYQTSVVERGTLITSVTASGTISAGKGSNITTGAGGVVRQVYVKDGDYVVAGQKIAEISLDQDSLQKQTAAWASYLQAKNSLNSAKSRMNALQAALFKANQTFVKGAGTADPVYDDPTYILQRAEWLQAESDYNNQAGVIAQAEAALSSAWYSYQQISSSVTAPVSGKVANLSVTAGQTLTQTSGSSSTNGTSLNTTASQTIATVVSKNNEIQAAVNLTEIDIPKVKTNQKATMTLDAHPDKTFTGKVASINTSGSVSSGVTNYPVTITFDSGMDGIYRNMAVSATIITDVADNVLTVPSAAVQTTDGESSVKVLVNGQPVLVVVETGKSNDTTIEIKSGLGEGQTIITGQIESTSGSNQTSGSSPFSSFRGGAGGSVMFRR